MANRSHFNGSSLNFAAYILVPLYLCIGFIPNWQAVDKIASMANSEWFKFS